VSDDFEPAIAPTETAAEVAAAIVAPDDTATPAAGPRTHRAMSDGTRKLFQSIADKHKASEPGEQLEVDDLVPVTHETSVAAAGDAAGAVPHGDPAKPATAAPAAAAPATEIAAKAIEHQRKVEHDLREKSLADRELALTTREKSLPTRERYLEKSGETLRDLIKEWTGAATDAELRDAITDAVTELTHDVLGVPLDPTIKREVESRKALRTVKSYQTSISKQQEKLQADRVQAEQEQREQHAIGALAYVLNQKPDAYPDLMIQDDADPQAIVWSIIKRQHDKSGVEMAWEEAAALANKYYAEKESAKTAKRTRLLNPAAPKAQPANAGVTQGVSPQNRQAPQTPQKPVTAAETTTHVEPVDEATRRRQSLGRIMPKLKEGATP
jgi:hypothetical protein